MGGYCKLKGETLDRTL